MPTDAKKILIISPTPTHPTNAGNRSCVLSLARNLRQEGFDLYFLLLEYEEGDKQAMEDWWQDHILYFSREEIFPPKGIKGRLIDKRDAISRKIKKQFGRSTGYYTADDIKYNTGVDEHYPPTLDARLLALQEQYQFDAVIATYVFFSRALTLFKAPVLKIIDTHDIFSNRYKTYLDSGREPEWISLFPQEEKRGFERADVILSIQENEKEFIKSLSMRSQVLLIGPTLEWKPVPDSYDHSLLFIASPNTTNIDGINDFINHVFRDLRRKYPDCSLRIGGSIVNARQRILEQPGVEYLGTFEHIEEAYSRGCIVICPIRIGTGIKVKLLEALSFGKVAVATEAAAEGLEPYAGKYFLKGRDAKDTLEKISQLFSDREQYDKIKKALPSFCREYNHSSQLRELYKAIRTGVKDPAAVE